MYQGVGRFLSLPVTHRLLETFSALLVLNSAANTLKQTVWSTTIPLAFPGCGCDRTKVLEFLCMSEHHFKRSSFNLFFFFFKQENGWPTSHRMHLQMRQTPVSGDPQKTFNLDDQLTGWLECVWSSAHFLWHEIDHCCVSSCWYWVCFSVILSVWITLFEVGQIFMSWWWLNFTWARLWRVEELTQQWGLCSESTLQHKSCLGSCLWYQSSWVGPGCLFALIWKTTSQKLNRKK